MIYVMSDLHGCYEKYMAMLEKIRFSENDTLYILGDVVDRGEGGIKILQDMMRRKNIKPLLGNHDDWTLKILRMLKNPKTETLSKADMSLLQAWLSDGGKPTFTAFAGLSEEEQQNILTYLDSFGLYEVLTVGGNKFFWRTASQANERCKISPQERQRTSLSPSRNMKKNTSRTPISSQGIPRRALLTETAAAESGTETATSPSTAVFDNPLACLYLDTMEEFYVE